MVRKRDGATERYDRRKVIQSIEIPCVKRPISPEEIESMVDDVEDELARRGEDGIESRLIGQLVMDRLKMLDHVAYVRFASVYRNFQDLEEFYEELRDLSARRARAALNRDQAELPFQTS